MVALGLVLLVLCLAGGAAVAVSNPDTTSVDAFGYALSGLTLGGLFLLGMALGALALLGLALMVAGARRKRARKSALKSEVREVRTERETLAEENARLQAQLDQTQLEQARAVTPYPADERSSTQVTGKHRA